MAKIQVLLSTIVFHSVPRAKMTHRTVIVSDILLKLYAIACKDPCPAGYSNFAHQGLITLPLQAIFKSLLLLSLHSSGAQPRPECSERIPLAPLPGAAATHPHAPSEAVGNTGAHSAKPPTKWSLRNTTSLSTRKRVAGPQ